MKLGFFLPQIGPAAGPQAIVQVARRAEELGYDSLWVTDRLLYPVQPQSPYPATPDGALPEVYKTVYDPIVTLTLAAAHTSRIAVGTSILVMSYRNPLLLAKSLATLDAISGGRLQVGLGQGWSKDEHDAVGVSMKDRSQRGDEVVQVLKAVWGDDPVEFRGKFYQIPASHIGPKPVQRPHPPLYLAAYTPGAMKRVATHADGWHPVGVPLEGMAQMMESIRDMAREAGRDPAELKLVVRGNLMVTNAPLGDDRWMFTGSRDQIQSDIQAVRRLNADELILDTSFSSDGTSAAGFEKSLEEMKRLADAG
jgi:probable F420-dependent oxidoreductase